MESPQVLDLRDVMKEPNIFKVSKSVAFIQGTDVLDNIIGVKVLPIKIIRNISQI